MAYVTAFKGILFIEGEHPRAEKIQYAEINLSGIGAQLKNLNDLKEAMANVAVQHGCNCIVNFAYGQKAKLMAIDDVSYVGSGYYARLSPQDYGCIISQL